MNMKFLPAAMFAICVTVAASAQTKEKNESKERSKKDQTITIRKKSSDKNEKMTIVVDGDKITVNGKPIEDMKDSDVEVLRGHGMHDLGMLMPKISGRMGKLGDMKMWNDEFPFGGNRAYLGVGSEKVTEGAKITNIEKESAAEKAGLKKDDIITKVGDTKIEDGDDLYEAIGKYKPEEKVIITYLRDGKTATTTATLGKSNSGLHSFNFKDGDFNKDFNHDFNFRMPDMKGFDNFDFMRKPRLGVEIQDLAEGKGVKILDVDNDTPAGKAGLQKDDVITEINGQAIATVDELKTKLRDLKEGDSIKVTYQRNGKTQGTEIKFPKKLKTAEL
jgi:serine protease Do